MAAGRITQGGSEQTLERRPTCGETPLNLLAQTFFLPRIAGKGFWSESVQVINQIEQLLVYQLRHRHWEMPMP